MQDAMEVDEVSDVARDNSKRDVEPGATIMWFGDHEGTRLDKLEEWYRRYLLYYSKVDPTPNVSVSLQRIAEHFRFSNFVCRGLNSGHCTGSILRG